MANKDKWKERKEEEEDPCQWKNNQLFHLSTLINPSSHSVSRNNSNTSSETQFAKHNFPSP